MKPKETKCFWNSLFTLRKGLRVKIIKHGSGYRGRIGKIESKQYSRVFKEWMYLIRFAPSFCSGYWKRGDLEIIE